MPNHRLALAPIAVLGLLLGGACDESSRPPASEPPPSESQPETGTPEPAESTSGPSSPEPVQPVEPAPPSGGPHCDQRQASGGESKCIDYTEHTGPVAPRCFADVPLGEGPCPNEGVVGKCKLPSTGVTLVYYQSTQGGADAARQICKTIDGVFEVAEPA